MDPRFSEDNWHEIDRAVRDWTIRELDWDPEWLVGPDGEIEPNLYEGRGDRTLILTLERGDQRKRVALAFNELGMWLEREWEI